MSQASVQKHTQLFEPFKGYKTSIWSKMAPTRPTFETLTEVWVSSRPCFTFADFTLVFSHSLCTKTDRSGFFFTQEVKQAQVLYHMEGWWFDLSRVPVCVPKYPWARCWTVIGQCSHESVNVRWRVPKPMKKPSTFLIQPECQWKHHCRFYLQSVTWPVASQAMCCLLLH